MNHFPVRGREDGGEKEREKERKKEYRLIGGAYIRRINLGDQDQLASIDFEVCFYKSLSGCDSAELSTS